jgi:nitrate reductase alpha subunit
MGVTRRTFLEMCGIGSGAAALALAGCKGGSRAFKPAAVTSIDNPLASYPARDWEKVYLDQYRYDSSFTWVCSPNCTHECRMRGFVRNGVMVRAEQNYDSHRVSDLDGNTASAAWNPRGCSNGLSFQRRVYGTNRLRHPILRKGWKEWADAGFPDLDQAGRAKYKFDSRGTDEFVRASWDDALGYAARAMVAIAKRYSGDAGKKRLLDAGYPPEMLDHWEGAGTRTFKLRGGMGLLGITGKYGMYRFSNMLALLDAKVRGVGPEAARGARNWSNYTWHGDQAPGHPFVHGMQTSDCDLSDMRSTKLHVHIGKNMIENKRADNHFLSETMERGAKIVVVAPEYSATGTKADVWVPIRPGTDAALLLGVTRLMIDEHWYDEDFVKKFTDFPLLVRTDTLRRLAAADVIPDYRPPDLSGRPSMKRYGLTAEQRDRLGDFVVWDKPSGAPRAVTRDDVGEELAKLGVDPALDGTYTVKLVSGGRVKVMPLFAMYRLHLRDYGVDTVAEICQSPADMIRQLAKDLATIKPAAIHIGEGLNHYFHATEANRAAYLPLMLTGNIGRPGAGSHTWAGNYKAGILQGSKETGPGFKGWVGEDPWHLNLDPGADGKDIVTHGYSYGEEVGYWNYGDRPLIVDTPKGRKVFTGKTHMPTPTRLIWYSNVNLINNAKWAYEMIKNVDPQIELIMGTDIEHTGSIEYSDIGLPASSWIEISRHEITAACSNPWFQIWKGGVAPVYDTKDDVMILAELAARLGREIGEPRMTDMWRFAHEGNVGVYIQRMLDGSTTGRGYKVEDILAGKYGEPGAAMCLYRTYPRIPFWEQSHESHPFFSATGPRPRRFCPT